MKKIVLSHEELALLLGGIDLTQTRPRKWYRKPLGGSTNRVTENRINTGHFARFLDRSLLFKKHREHAL